MRETLAICRWYLTRHLVLVSEIASFRVFVPSCFRDKFILFRLVRVRELRDLKSAVRIPKSKIL